ncbi:MAG: tetratricopeptide repeat protein [Polyangiaceae bacterium]|nr:tetratricopeptide repeat protein [Polyangiaceae bacterium]
MAWFDTWAGVAVTVLTAFVLFRSVGLPLSFAFKPVGALFVVTLTVLPVLAGVWVQPFSYGRLLVAELVVIVAWYALVMRARWMQRQASLIADPAKRAAVLERVEKRIPALLSKPAKKVARDLRTAGLICLVCGKPERAVELLRTADVSDLDEEGLAGHIGNLAIAQLQLGDAPAALAALEGSAALSPGRGTAVRLAEVKALVLAVCGRQEEALALLPARGNKITASLTRAHALAAGGDSEAARTELERFLAEHGRESLEAVVRHRGPASPVAQSMLDAPGTPYR